MKRPGFPEKSAGRHLTRRFAASRQANATVEFALCGLALTAFLLGIVNLGLLGFTIGALQHAVEQAARTAAVSAAGGACPTLPTIKGYFNTDAAPAIPANGATLAFSTYSNGSVSAVSGPWVDNGTSSLPGTYIALTASYNWKPIGFASFVNIPLTIKTVAFAMGSPTC
ncbi:MAG TPA: TadE family protein [Acidocella sp.]|jgi:Flp pilus assembly protein TadG|uniref:TadE/TadG family type IV pilus assembly protein n=1 Tax=Acidocella sp. TaxID=50710 RepID=UPI002C5E6C53|nr:TadE family protein [Acidocella sp.]HVE20918.1 TadE family protein [Acidocella sp.]